MRRVVVTGFGAVSPLGGSISHTWEGIIAGKSGIRALTRGDLEKIPVAIGGEVPLGTAPGELDIDALMSAKDRRKIDPFIVYAIAAADQALAHARWTAETEEQKCRTGVMIGSGVGGLPGIYEASVLLHERGARRVSPFFIPSTLVNLAAGNVAIRHGFKGPNHASVTACSAGAHAIGDAGRMIAMNDVDVMVAGGAEAAICPIGVAGFVSAKALSQSHVDAPEKASRPWDKARDGFVMGEGAGLMVLEELEHARARGATIYAELVGYGLSGDGYHVTSPPEDGDGAYRAMCMAQARAGIAPEDIDYINAHGTSTPVGDLAELRAIKKFLGGARDVSISSTKSSTGHLLGASGGLEAVFAVLAIKDQIAPPTLNLTDPDDEVADLDLVPGTAKKRKIQYAMSNSFGFGGTNSSLIFKQFSA